jgi:hypothetical protein
MKKLLLLIACLLLATACSWGQMRIEQYSLRAFGQTYAAGVDTSGVIFKDATTATEDSVAIFNIHLGSWTGYGLGFVVEFSHTAGNTYCDSIKVEAAPRVRVKTKGADSTYYETVWTDAITLYTQAGASCNFWAPTVHRKYVLYSPTWWNGVSFSDISLRITNQSLVADSALIKKCLCHFQD